MAHFINMEVELWLNNMGTLWEPLGNTQQTYKKPKMHLTPQPQSLKKKIEPHEISLATWNFYLQKLFVTTKLMEIKWELDDNTLGTKKIQQPQPPPKEKNVSPPTCMLPHLIGYKKFCFLTCVLCHFLPRLLAGTRIMLAYWNKGHVTLWPYHLH